MSKGVIGSILGAAVVAFALLAGCGGSDEPEALTKAQFVKQATEVCRKGEKERGKIVERFAQEAKPGEAEAVKKQEEVILEALPTYEKTITGLEELGVPEGDEQKVEDVIEAMKGAAENVKANPGSAIIGSIPFKEANEELEGYGLDACVV
ncbi:MAG: hypothetical protein M3335_00390 [Actinomycetota bacterium]|nr:hypothetical protein [Actinomycetota bacterium]